MMCTASSRVFAFLDTDREVAIFDCIEFDEEMRRIDVMSAA